MKRACHYLALSEIYRVPPKGGHVVWLHNVCRRLPGVRLLTGRIPDKPRAFVYDGIEVRCIDLSRWPILRPESAVLYANLFLQGLVLSARSRPQAVLAARALPEGLVAGGLGRVLGMPSVVFAHGEEIYAFRGEAPTSLRRRGTAGWKRRFLWRTYRMADLILANTRFTADLLREGGIAEEQVAVVHPGTDPDRFRPEPKDLHLSDRLGVRDRKVILTVGTLKQRKGQDMVIRALPAIRAKVPGAVYLMAGTGQYGRDLRNLAASVGVASDVRFLGGFPDEMLPKLYNLADVFVMANRTLPEAEDVEGFGIVFLEAGACGVPTVGGRSGGVPEAVLDGQTGLLVDGNSLGQVASGIIRVLTDADLARRLGRNARDRVCRELTWAHSAGRVKTLIDGLGGRRRGTAGRATS